MAHTWCVKKAGLSHTDFECRQISEHFVPDVLGSKRARVREPLAKQIDPGRFFCLICGDRVAEWEPEYRGIIV